MTAPHESRAQTSVTRRQLREEQSAPATRRPSVGRVLGRLAVLGALVATTWVVPATGLVLPSNDVEESAGPVLSETSALDVMASLSAEDPEAQGAGSLLADPEASGRAMLSASRNNTSRDDPTCSMFSVEANGTLAAESSTGNLDMVRPLPEGSYRVTSTYGFRVHPIFGRSMEHSGYDMAAPTGTPIYAIADGVVTHAGQGRDGRSGMLIIIKHEIDGAPVWTWYVHMYPDGVFVTEGQQVQAGEQIGTVGSYGYSTGPHLHLEVHSDDNLTTVDPESWMEENGAVPMNPETMACAGN